jgi:hypothetical protein
MCSSRVSLISLIMRRQTELVDAGQTVWDQTEGGADRATLVVGVDPEAGVSWDRVGEVELPVCLQALALVVGKDRVDDLARVGRRQDRIVGELGEAASNSQRGVRAGAQMQVGCAAGDNLQQQLSEIEAHGEDIVCTGCCAEQMQGH